jgi:hypothetical protein
MAEVVFPDTDTDEGNFYTEVIRDLGPQLVVIPDEDETPPTAQPKSDTEVKKTKYTRASALSENQTEQSRAFSLDSVQSDTDEPPEVPPYNPNILPSPPPTETDLLLEPPVRVPTEATKVVPSPAPQSPSRIGRSRSPLPDYMVTSCLMSLKEAANPEKATLPQLYKVETEYYGREIHLQKNEFIMAMYKKQVVVVEGVDNNGQRIYLSQNSPKTMCPIYNEIQQSRFLTARALHASMTLPPVAKVREGFTDEKGVKVEPGTLLYFKTETKLKALSRKVRKAIIRAKNSDRETISIASNCPGVFSSHPDDLKLYLPEVIHHCQLPMKVLFEDGVYTTDAVTLQRAETLEVLVAQRYDSLKRRRLSQYLEIPVECPVAMVKVSLRNREDEKEIYSIVHETLKRKHKTPAESSEDDPNLYSYIYHPEKDDKADLNDSNEYACVLDWSKHKENSTQHGPSTPSVPTSPPSPPVEDMIYDTVRDMDQPISTPKDQSSYTSTNGHSETSPQSGLQQHSHICTHSDLTTVDNGRDRDTNSELLQEKQVDAYGTVTKPEPPPLSTSTGKPHYYVNWDVNVVANGEGDSGANGGSDIGANGGGDTCANNGGDTAAYSESEPHSHSNEDTQLETTSVESNPNSLVSSNQGRFKLSREKHNYVNIDNHDGKSKPKHDYVNIGNHDGKSTSSQSKHDYVNIDDHDGRSQPKHNYVNLGDHDGKSQSKQDYVSMDNDKRSTSPQATCDYVNIDDNDSGCDQKLKEIERPSSRSEVQ